MVAFTDPGLLKSEFDFLKGMFDWVGLRTNIRKTVGMACQTLQVAGVQADEAYTRSMTGEERIFKEQQRERVSFPE